MIPPVRIIEDVNLTEDGPPITVHRTWRERLFSRPWRPFMRTKEVTPKVPYRGALKMPDGSLVMHPATAREFRNLTEKDKHP